MPGPPLNRCAELETHGRPAARRCSRPRADGCGHRTSYPRAHYQALSRNRGNHRGGPPRGSTSFLAAATLGKTTILEAIALLLSPTNAVSVSDTDYYMRKVDAEFVIEGVFTLPPESGINDQLKPSWPWEWNGTEAVVPSGEGEAPKGEAVYCPARARHGRPRTRV